MYKKFLSAIFAGILALSLTACNKAEETDTTEDTIDTGEEVTEETSEERPGEWLPFEYPETTTTAVAGDWLLTPAMEMLDEAFVNGTADQTVFIFYTAKMITPGETSSVVEDLLGDQHTVPNALIVPLKKGQTAEVGDVLLSWWQSGSGLYRAIATSAGTAPSVVYLDGFGTREDTFDADTFHKLTGELEAGVGVAVNTGSEYEHATLINVNGDKAIVSGFAGSLEMVDTSALTPMPSDPGLVVGDTFQAPVIGAYRSATVTAIDAATGEITAEYEFGGEISEDTFYYGEVIKSL